MSAPTIALTHVDTRPHRQVVDARVATGQSIHRIGHLPGEGWFCDCSRARSCPHIDRIRQLVPRLTTPDTT